MSILDDLVTRLDSVFSRPNRNAGYATSPVRPLDADAQGWSNPLTGMGFAATDKGASTSYSQPVLLREREATSIYRGDGIARRVVDAVPAEALRRGYELREDDDEIEGWEDWAGSLPIGQDEVGLDTALERWMCWHRLYGGAALVLLTDSGVTDQPMVQGERLVGLRVLSRYDLQAEDAASLVDPMRSEPEVWRVRGTGLRLHSSRLLLLGRSRLPVAVRPPEGWDDSIYVRGWQALSSNGTLDQTATSILHQFVTPVQRMRGLASLMSGNGPEAVMRRFGLQQLIRSAHRVTVLDADSESYELQTTSVSGLPELMDRFPERVSAVYEIPLTVLMGRSPGGLNATGESDLRIWYDSIARREQQGILRHALRRIASMAFALRDGPTGGRVPSQFRVKFRPLWEMSEAEREDVALKRAQRDAIYLDRLVLTAAEVADARFGGMDGDVPLLVARDLNAAPLADETA